MKLHSLLCRQLKHSGLKVTTLPNDFNSWQEFIQHINTVYNEADQERELIERSMDISSREFMELNSKLEDAEKIAGLGYWQYDSEANWVFLSRILRELLRLTPDIKINDYKSFMALVHPADRKMIASMITRTINAGKEFKTEARLLAQNKYYWFYLAGAILDSNNNGRKQMSGIMMNIDTRKKSEAKIAKLQAELIVTAREIGMSDVATFILHNVGNILNSVNVSVNIIEEELHGIYYQRLFEINKILEQNISNLTNYFLYDEKGKMTPIYLNKLITILSKKHKTLYKEIASLTKKLQHINEIMTTQTSFGRQASYYDKINIPEIIDDALKLTTSNDITLQGIVVNKKFYKDLLINADKVKVLQILVNLIQNAKESLNQVRGKNKVKEINIYFNKNIKTNSAQIIVEDNGVGIAKNKLTTIFSLGYSTKKYSRGIGLHSSAIAAREMNGKLRVESEGLGKGAKFILTLPLKTVTRLGQQHA